MTHSHCRSPQIVLLITILATLSSTAEQHVFRYGFAPDRVSFSGSGWYADSDKGHATEHEDQYDHARITIGMTNRFIRSYLWKIEELPGVRKPGRITFRLRRRGDSSKIILQTNGIGICTYLNKDPDADRYIVTGLTNKIPIYWGSRAELRQWHDFTLEYDGQNRYLIIDHDTVHRYQLATGKTPHADHLSLGMGFEYGKDMYIDVESITFADLDEPLPVLKPSPRPDGSFTILHDNGFKRLTGSFTDGKLEGKLTRWHQDGALQSTGTYTSDQRHGEWVWWYPDGREHRRVQYRHGQLHGQYLSFYPNGQLETTVRYQNDLADGLFLRWFDDGAPMFVGGYRQNVMHGHWTQWGAHGHPQWSHMSTHGKKDVFLKLWHANGQLRSVTYYLNTLKHGPYHEYYPDGQMHRSGMYHQGSKVGDWTTRDTSGKITSHETFPMPTQ